MSIYELGTIASDESTAAAGRGAAVDFENFTSAIKNSVASKPQLAAELNRLTKAQNIMLYGSATQGLDLESFGREKSSISKTSTKSGDVRAIQVGGINMPEDYKSALSVTQESFAKRNPNRLTAANAQINVGIAVQDKFGECFFATTPLKQDEAGKVYEVAIPFRYDGVMGADFTPNRFFDSAVNLIDSLYNPSILNSATTRLVPNLTTSKSGTNEAGSYSAVSINVYFPGGVNDKLAVNPILSGTTIDLFDTDKNPASPAVEEALDHISPALMIEKIVFKNQVNGGGTQIPFMIDTRSVAGAQIQRNQAGGNEYDYILNLTGRITVGPNTKDIAGATLFGNTILQSGATNAYVELEYSVTGTVNLRDRTINFTVGVPQVKSAFSVVAATGVKTPISLTSAAAGANIVAVKNYFTDATVEKSYWPNATRANTTARVAGIFVDYKLAKWSTAVDFGAPISVLNTLISELSEESEVEMKVETMRQAGYAQTCGLSVTRLLEQASVLEDKYGTAGTAQYVRTRNDFGLPSSHYVMPYFKRATLDVTTIVNSIKSSEKMTDIQSALLNYIRQEAYEMIRLSRYRAAFQIMYPNKMINVKIGTDTVLARYIIQQGDIRTLGEDVTCELVATDNLSMKNKFVLVLGQRVDEVDEGDFLSFGKHFVAPETIFEINDSLASKFGGIKRTTYYPRQRHVAMNEIMVVLDVVNLAEAVQLTTAYVAA